MHWGEVVVTVHPEIPTIRADGKYSERPFRGQVLAVGSCCKVPECNLTNRHDTMLPARATSLEESSCKGYVTSIAITRDSRCLFLCFSEYIHSETDCRFKGSTHLNLLCIKLSLSPYWFSLYKLWLDLQTSKKWDCAKSHPAYYFFMFTTHLTCQQARQLWP